MTRMAGANPKIAAIFGENSGPNFGDMGNQAMKGQGYLQRAAMQADANAAKSDIEAEYIKNVSLRPIDSPFGHCAANPGNDKNFELQLDKNIKELLNE